MRVRKVIGRSGVIERFSLASIKNGGQVHCEGPAEWRYARILEASGDVLRYEEQALYVPFEFGGKASKSPPDFCVTFVDGHHEIHEVKTLLSLKKKKDAIPRVRAIARGARGLGDQYRVVTELYIDREPRRSTADLICGRGRIELEPGLVSATRELASQGLTLGDLRLQLDATRDDLCALILQGHLWIRLDDGFTPNTPVLGLGWRRQA